MITYCDTNILIKRVLDEGDADDVVAGLATRAARGEVLLTSSLARTEIRRTLIRAIGWDGQGERLDVLTAMALSGLFVEAVDEHTVALAGHLPARFLGTLDAIHVATALRSRSSLVLTRDRQMARACEELGLAVA